MTSLDDYKDKYPDIRFNRTDGILQLTLHTDGGAFTFSERAHHDLGLAFHDVADDLETKVVIITGTGDRFCADFDSGSFLRMMRSDPSNGLYRIRNDGRRMLSAFLDIEVPVIAAVNGPVASHSELPVLADLVLAADDAFFQDATHFPAGAVPGDGVHMVWTKLLGINRGKYFLLTGEKISAQEGQKLGFVSEVLPADRLLERAWELARHWARLPRMTLCGTRHVLNYEWKRLFLEQLHNGLTEEMFAGAFSAIPEQDPDGPTDLIGT